MTARTIWMLSLLVLAPGPCTRGPGAAIPESGRISCGLTGLMAGRGRGYVIHADGRVETWTGRTTAEGVAPIGVAPAQDLAALWSLVRAADFFARDDQALTAPAAFVAVESEERSHRLSWPVGPDAPPADSLVLRVFDACQQAGTSAQSAGDG